MAKSGSNKIPAPKGTRDLYPQDLLRQRYITEAWRRVSIRHGFDEIAGPTFEMLDLYKKKSGEGIVSELFSFTRAGGDDDYALRPEFTPTLARMYAERAKQLPSPCKWFTAGPYFRAEKPQRGRLREFMQWNCDVLGGDENAGDADTLAVLSSLIEYFGISKDMSFRVNDRMAVEEWFLSEGISPSDIGATFGLMDQRAKISEAELQSRAETIPSITGNVVGMLTNTTKTIADLDDEQLQLCANEWFCKPDALNRVRDLGRSLESRFLDVNVQYDSSIARGLAYYTGTVFELIADGERAVAGGGRYDNLIELFGGPPTPAVGFGMGDVVLGLLLEDKGLMPEGPDLADALSQKPASIRPEAFVIANEEGEAHVEPLLAKLRRGKEAEGFDGKPWDADRYSVNPMHARRSYKSTKNIGKLLADARKQHAKFAIIIESDDSAKIENLTTREEVGTFGLDQIAPTLAKHL